MALRKKKLVKRGCLAPALSHIFAEPWLKAIFIVPFCIGVASMNDRAFAISLEVAKKCNALTAQAFPPRVIGNPAAGSAKGSGREERAYYRKCVANEGKIDAQPK